MYSGTTATVVFITDDTLYLANVGDSRAILCRKEKPLRISVDHNLLIPEEVDRVTKLGGVIIEDNPPRVKGMISITRAIGDSMFHPFVIAEPRIHILKAVSLR
jgi:serine/threonine protein phosphatase PrpC